MVNCWLTILLFELDVTHPPRYFFDRVVVRAGLSGSGQTAHRACLRPDMGRIAVGAMSAGWLPFSPDIQHVCRRCPFIQNCRFHDAQGRARKGSFFGIGHFRSYPFRLSVLSLNWSAYGREAATRMETSLLNPPMSWKGLLYEPISSDIRWKVEAEGMRSGRDR